MKQPLNEMCKKSLCSLFIIFCLFPYLRIIPFNLDAQPNALVLSVPCIILFHRRSVPKEIALLLCVFLVAGVIMIFSNFNAVGLRVLANYASLFLIAYATYLSMEHLKGLPYRLFRYSVYVWFVVGFIQSFFFPSFLSVLTLRGGETSMAGGRGICSLAVEPTYYGMICVFMAILNYLNFRHCRYYKWLSVLILIQLLFSKSTTVFLWLGLSALIYSIFLIFKSRKKLVILLGIVVALYTINDAVKFYTDSSDSRFASVLSVLVYSPEKFLLMDYSVNNRFMHAFFPIKGFIDNIGLPHGLGRFNDYLIPMSHDSTYGELLPYDYSEEFRINSALSGALYDLGIFALPILIIIFRCIMKLSRTGYNGILCGVVLVSMMLNNMPFSQAILPFMFGDLIYLSNRRKPTL